VPVETKTLPHHALDPVAGNRGWDTLAGDSQAEPRVTEIVRLDEGDPSVMVQTPWVIKHAPELFLAGQAIAPGKATPARTQRTRRQADRRARPFARRALRIRRPFLVRMRARNPWVRLRCRLLGWKVLFMAKACERLGKLKRFC